MQYDLSHSNVTQVVQDLQIKFDLLCKKVGID